MTTCIRAADWVVAYDPATDRHVYLQNADVAFSGDQIIHVGARYQGKVTHEIPGANRMVLPGLVDIHGHLGTEPFGKGFFEDLGNLNHHMSRLYEYIYTVRPPDARARRAATRLSIMELLLSGATTVADMSLPYDGWEDTCAATGARVYLVPMFKSAAWTTPDGNRIDYAWDIEAGERGLAEAIMLIQQARAHPSGRLDGMLMPAQSDTCTPELLTASAAAARELGFPLQIHSGQSLPEFHEMIRRHGKTAIAFMHDLGILGPNTTLAHAIFIDSHPWLHWHQHDDLAILGATKTNVVHCPTVFAYRGVMLHDFGSYLKAGVNMAIGTDTTPHDMVGEMRLALFTAKLAKGHVSHTRTEDVFHAATLGGARALGRPDLGRIAVGAKADLALVDLAHPKMQPFRDPLRAFIFAGGAAVVRDVWVAGVQLVAAGAPLMVDLPEVLSDMTSGHAVAMRDVSSRDWAARSAEQISPLALPVVPV